MRRAAVIFMFKIQIIASDILPLPHSVSPVFHEKHICQILSDRTEIKCDFLDILQVNFR